MSLFQITRRLEFDAGHRIPNHQGQCRHLHGHRYQIEVTLRGELNQSQGSSEEGMMMDFGHIKSIMQELIIDPWDHSFFVAKIDTQLIEFLKTIPDHKTTIIDGVPTAENLAKIAFDLVAPVLLEKYLGRIRLYQLRLYETPNCWADIFDEPV
ncbi:6-carboxytetrahydropterin synthase QueD [Polynucleobacter sp. SHI8]|uniref:6-carboxytetrahydropterin synthase QueD n=1 Tax=unclassified Polynucleobacter TaxID=2640945 RepID=UPI0024904EFE|nr:MULTISPECIES: 6-carboxytetrahydropterin synthase QueD [unclassified Polynucleobacter]BDW11119.1 6-carboxytetrahydropterin synthase QueD [Polynucleobacter sp. SHI2]BDW13565.1 6-carboxytetrahydropterin synthase QueD [Polynucleobacter sp. SHI8]